MVDKTILRCIGLMSGTSMDGIDAVILETDGHVQMKHQCAKYMPYAREFQILLRAAEFAVREYEGSISNAGKNFSHKFDEYLKLNFTDVKPIKDQLAIYLHKNAEAIIEFEAIVLHSTKLHAKIVQELIESSEFKSSDIDLIGYHGQALYHNPSKGITVQVGSGELLSNLVHIPVINNFRINDVANGGQGAPLAPLYHKALALAKGYDNAAIVNCGGIANITFVTGPKENDILAFDTGPGNVLIDRYVRLATSGKEFIDRDGKYGLSGIVHVELIEKLYEKTIVKDGINYYEKIPPKSLDPFDIKLITELTKLSLNDVCATLAAFTAFNIVESIKFLNVKLTKPKIWILAGGGWRNPVILDKFKQHLAIKIPTAKVFLANDIGWNNVSMEAEIFAYFAVRTLKALPISHPNTTNVKRGTLCGAMHLPDKDEMIAKKINWPHLSPKVSNLFNKNIDIVHGYKVSRRYDIAKTMMGISCGTKK